MLNQSVYNIFQNLPDAEREEQEEIIWEDDTVRITRILSRGQSSGPYKQRENEWLILLVGESEIVFPEEGDNRIVLRSGDFTFIAAGRKHIVERTSDPCLWLCVFYK